MDRQPAAVLRSRRLVLGVTQAELAHAAGVSLATVQNIEAGRANPALGTVERVCDVLALDVVVVPRTDVWDELVALGLPLARTAETPAAGGLEAIRRDAVTLRSRIALGFAELRAAGAARGAPAGRGVVRDAASGSRARAASGAASRDGPTPTAGEWERRRDALEALLLAFLLHWPADARRSRRWLNAVSRLISDETPGRVIKLARIARAHLAGYL